MNGLYDFPAGVRAAAEAAMTAGETVLWAGRPSPARAFLGTTAIWIFAVPWTAFSMVFFGSGIAGVTGLAKIEGIEGIAGWIFLMFSLPFVFFGLVLFALPFLSAQDARQSAFVVTNRRVLKVTGGGDRRAKALAGRSLRGVASRIGADGRGVVRALGPVGKDSDGDWVSDQIEMIGVSDAAGAEAALWRLIELSGGPPRDNLSDH